MRLLITLIRATPPPTSLFIVIKILSLRLLKLLVRTTDSGMFRLQSDANFTQHLRTYLPTSTVLLSFLSSQYLFLEYRHNLCIVSRIPISPQFELPAYFVLTLNNLLKYSRHQSNILVLIIFSPAYHHDLQIYFRRPFRWAVYETTS